MEDRRDSIASDSSTQRLLNEDSEHDPDTAIKASGGFGKYQIIGLIMLMFNYSLTAMFNYGVVYVELFPKLYCTDKEGNEDVCHFKDICEEKYKFKDDPPHRIDFDHRESLVNWVGENQLNMYCYSKFEIGLFGTCYFFGQIFMGIGLS